MTSEKEWLAAEEQGREETEKGFYALAANYDVKSQTMHVILKNGFTVSFPKQRSQIMASVTDDVLKEVTVVGAGRYIIFPKLDDGFTVEGMLAGHFGDRHWEESWAASHRTVAA